MLATGTRLGPYEILGLVGEGGMGQVYRAADTRLDRAVAIKVLPAEMASDPVRRDRFEREARSISKLEHPNICPLYDVGQLPADAAGSAGLFLVMQFLEGESLAQRLERGALSIKETLEFGIQIAEALAAAHRAGIVHRDLKPGNIMLTRAGARLLDFGLARSVPGTGPGGATMAGDDRTSLTTMGTVLGTLHYMAPEQLEGKDIDTRADVFAFGAVLFEMVTGLKAFSADSPAGVMSAILRDEPARASSLAPVTPAGLDELIHTCLEKKPDDRWQGMSDVARQLRWLQSGMSGGKSGAVARADVPAAAPPVAAASPAATAWRWGMIFGTAAAVAAAVFAVLGIAAVLTRDDRRPGDRLRLHAFLLPPAGYYLTGGLALSADGRQLAFVAADANGLRQLWVRPLDSSRTQPLAGTEGASDPFWSPDGSEIAFFANNQLKRVPASGGAPAVITEAGIGAGGSWSASGTIVFQPHQQGHLMRVAAAGGQAEPVTALDAATAETHHLYPSFLPDGRHFVFYVAGKQRGLYVGRVDGPERTFLFDPDPSLPPGAAATPGRYAESGHLLYVRDRVLMARAFDAGARTASGEPIKVADAVDYEPPGQAAFAVAGSVLIYRPRQHLPLATLAWLDRSGQEVTAIGSPPGAIGQVSLTADGRTAAVERRDAQGLSSVWLVDLARGTSARVPAEYWAGAPVWSPDDQLAYSIAADSPPNVVIRGKRGADAERRVTTAPTLQYASSFTPDGQTVVFRAFSNDTGWDLFTVPSPGGPPQRLLQTPANESQARVSPDGRMLAYTSDDSGRTEVYLSQFPEAAGRAAVSSGGGSRPMWRADGRELYFVTPDGRVMVAPVAAGSVSGPPTALFTATLFNGLFAPAADGQRFLVARPAPSPDIVPMELLLTPIAPK
ncbi:MAG: protein kinase [Vicinamibacterales bacterium]